MEVEPEIPRGKTQQKENTRRDHSQGREAGKFCRALEMSGSPLFSLPLSWMLKGCSSKAWVHTLTSTCVHTSTCLNPQRPSCPLCQEVKHCSEHLSQESIEIQGRVAVSPSVPRIRRRNLERGPKYPHPPKIPRRERAEA